MARVQDTAKLTQKFVTRATQAQGDYTDGVKASGNDWQAGASAAEPNYEAGVQAAIGRKAFSKGVAKAGAGLYVERASTLGAQRYPTGVGAAGNRWAANSAPYLDAGRQPLRTPRRPRGDPGNAARSAEMSDRFHKIRLAQ